MPTDVIIRSISKQDTQGVHAAALNSWKFTYRDIFDTLFIEDFVNKHYAPQATLSLPAQIESGFMFFHVAEYESQVIGFCNIEITNGNAELYRIYMLPAYIGLGIGHSLLEHGEKFLIEHEITQYFCHVHSRNEIGKRFYLKSGFDHVPAKDKDDEWYMEKNLPVN